MIVLDASAALELLINAPLAPYVAEKVFAPGITLHAPHLLDLEIAQVLRRLLRQSEIDEERALMVFEDLDDLAINRYPHQLLLPAIWSLRDNATAYDAAYLALAEELDATLLTCDHALGTIPTMAHRVSVIQSR
jgi:predicted nucleic acid-binding protein